MSSPRLFHPKDVTVEAVQWTGGNGNELVAFAGSDFEVLIQPCEEDGDATASLRESRHSSWRLVRTGDWIVKGVTGGLFLVSNEDFQKDYETAPHQS